MTPCPIKIKRIRGVGDLKSLTEYIYRLIDEKGYATAKLHMLRDFSVDFSVPSKSLMKG